MENERYLQMTKKLAEIHDTMGYSERPIYEYKEDPDLMEYEGDSQYAKKFNLRKSDVLAIMKVITESAAYQRGSQKSMMATKSNTVIPPENAVELKQIFEDSEALIQTRQTHEREVADIARIIANALGLNEDLSYLIGLTHDIGHTWNGHTGERILSAIGRLKDCGYIVHNAMGAYIMERESIVDRAIEDVKQFNPKANETEIKEFMRYVIDGIVSHNGEGTVGVIIPESKTTEKMAEEIKKCFTEKGYDKRIMPATMEGAVIRYADIIAYTRSDILDGFRLKDIKGNKILDGFDDEYLSIIGTCLAREENFGKMLELENKFLLEMYGLSKKIEELQVAGDKVELARTKKERDMIKAKYEEFEAIKIEYARDYIDGIKPESEVKTRVTQMMQNVFIKDLIEASKDKGYITMTPLMRKTLFALRDLNIRKIVPYTRRGFESGELPIAANELVDIFSEVLLKTGLAYKLIPSSVKKEGVEPAYSEGEQNEHINHIEGNRRLTYERKMCHYYSNQKPENLTYMYESTVEAMKDIIRRDIAIALGEEKYDGELKELYEIQKINPIKRMFGELRDNHEDISDSDREFVFNTLLAERQKDVEKIIASKMAIEYIGGMTDNTILSALLDKNLISREAMVEGYGRAVPGTEKMDSGVKKLQQVFSKNEGMIYPENLGEDEISL